MWIYSFGFLGEAKTSKNIKAQRRNRYLYKVRIYDLQYLELTKNVVEKYFLPPGMCPWGPKDVAAPIFSNLQESWSKLSHAARFGQLLSKCQFLLIFSSQN